MKKSFTLLLVFAALSVFANPVDKKLAEQVAIHQYAFNAPSAISDYSINGYTETRYEGITTFYTFSFTSGGFVMVAADDASIPVLGFSYEGNAAISDVNPEAAYWFNNYSRQIAEISSVRLSNQETRPLWDKILNNTMEREIMDVNPLLTTTWDQGCYYNALCPVETGAGAGSCNHAWTGCVATAMSQIMKYHAFPTTGIGYHSYTHNTYGLQSANFAGTTYNWAAMPNNVSSSNTSVATLMYHAGVSVNMQYAASGSGAYSEDVPFALVNYFNYAPSAEMKAKVGYPVMADWYALIRTDLDASRPVYYAGSSTASGGHAWVCDGYRISDNKFHFNWGWSGSYNGYFAIGSLNPGGNNFNDENRIIIGVTPGDNSATWLAQNSSFSAASRGISYMHAASATVAWGIGYDGSGSSATINEFTKTSNGGETWTTGQVLGGTTYGLGNICALNENVAYVALYNGVGAQNATCGVYKTSNGGTTWTQLPGALQGSASFANNVYFWDEQHGMCHGDVKDGYFEIYTTINGGTSWQRVSQANITGGTPASGEGGWTSVIDAVGDNTIMFGTNKGKVYISDDRGFTWRVTNSNITPATNGGINLIAFSDANNGIVAQTQGTVAVRKTTNGGATWTTITPSGPFLTNDLMAVPGLANTYISTGAATGATGLSISYDGGLTWSYFGGTSSKQFLAGDFFDNTCGYAGGFNENQFNGGMYRMIGQLGSTSTAAVINTDPTSFDVTLLAGESITTPLSILNSGDASLTWSISVDPVTATWLNVTPVNGTTAIGGSDVLDVTFDASTLDPGTYNAIIVVDNNSSNNPSVDIPVTLTVQGVILEAPYNLQATAIENNVDLTWSAPGGGSGTTQELIYDNGIATDGYTYNGYAMSIHMSPAAPCQVIGLKYFTTLNGGSALFNAEVYGWDAGTSAPSTTLLYEVGATAVDNDWVTIDIASANLSVTGDFVIGFGSIDETTFLGFDGGLDNGRSWDYDHAGGWSSWNEAYLIRAIVQYTDGSIAEIQAKPVVQTKNNLFIRKGIAHPTSSSPSAVEPIASRSSSNRALIGYNVYRNGVAIANLVTETIYTDANLDNGTYTYYVTAVYDNGESGPSNIVEVQITGVSVKPDITSNALSVYPNPVSDQLVIKSDKQILNVRLINSNGSELMHITPNTSIAQLNVSQMPKGMYLLHITTADGISTRKITIR